MENCRSGGFNTVLFQVRGNGTAFYRSRLEPWADELGGRDPGFDPLAVACREGHRRGLAVHAWANVMPAWRGDKPPKNRKQLYWTRPNWFVRDAGGKRQPLGWYNSLNPAYPEVRQYLVAVMREIIENYPIDGLHLDYIRFPNDEDETDYPRDARTLAAFHRATGRTPDGAPGTWNAWRAAQVTQLLRDIRGMALAVRPGAALSAAVGADPGPALRKHFQDSRRWIAEGLLDAVFPMNYAQDGRDFGRRVAVWSAMKTSIPVVMGVMFDGREPASVIAQIGRARAAQPHFAAFAYNALFERMDPQGRPHRDGQSAARAALRRQVIPRMRRLASARM